MKTFLLVLSLLSAAESTQAQLFIQGKAIPDSCRHMHVQVVTRNGRVQAQPRISGLPFERPHRLTTEAGVALQFDSFEGVLDYLDRAGWEYIDSLVAVGNAGGGTYAYLFRRKRSTASTE